MATFRGLWRRILVQPRRRSRWRHRQRGRRAAPLMDVSITEKTALSGAGVASIDAQTSMTATHRERKEASEDGGRSWSRAGPSTSPTGSFGTTRPSSRAGAGSSTQRARSTSTARWSWTTRPPGAAEESSTRSGCRHDPERKPYEPEHGDLQRRRGRQHGWDRHARQRCPDPIPTRPRRGVFVQGNATLNLGGTGR